MSAADNEPVGEPPQSRQRIQHRKLIEVITRSLANPEDVSRRQFDLYDHAGRTWMAKHAWWAAHAGYSVTTSPVVVEETTV